MPIIVAQQSMGPALTQTEEFVVPAGRKYEWKRSVVSYESEFGENSLKFYSKAKFMCVDGSCE